MRDQRRQRGVVVESRCGGDQLMRTLGIAAAEKQEGQGGPIGRLRIDLAVTDNPNVRLPAVAT